MKVHLINELKDNFKTHLKSVHYLDNAFYFEIVENWKNNWDIEEINLAATYDKSLTSLVSGRLWGGSENSAKSMMLKMIEAEREFLRSSFRDLFSDQKDLGLRLDRFVFHTDQVFHDIQKKHPKIVTHFHTDRKILCLYLALEFPDLYCLFDYPAFEKMMIAIEAKNIPTIAEVERYFKSCRGICKLISKDIELITLLKKHIPQIQGSDSQMMIMNLFMEFINKKRSHS